MGGGHQRSLSLGRAWRLLLCLLAVALPFAAAADAAPLPGTIATVAGGPVPGPVAATTVGQRPLSVAATRAGTPYLYVVDDFHAVVNRIDESTGQQVLFAGAGSSGSSPDGSLAAGSALSEPTAVAVDEAGDVFIEEAPARVRMVPAASGMFFGQAMTAGRLYTVSGTGTPGFGGDGGPATSAQLNTRAVMLPPGQIAVDAKGDLAIADAGNERVRFVPAESATYYGRAMTAGDIYTVAGNGEEGYGGDGGAGTSAKLNSPLGVAFDTHKNLVVADTENQRVRFISAQSETQFGQVMTPGDIYRIAGNGKYESPPEGEVATAGGLELPTAVALDAAGDVLVAEDNGYHVRAVMRVSGSLFGAPRAELHIYNVAGNGTAGFAGDGGAAVSAELGSVFGLALDASGNLLVADDFNGRVRLEPASAGTLFGGSREADKIYTVAGNGTEGFSGDGMPATGTELAIPDGVAVSPGGGFAITDFFNNRIRFVSAGEGVFGQAMSAGYMYTVAGNGQFGSGGDGGIGTAAQLSQPGGIAFDAAGDLAIAGRSTNRVRFIPASSGTFYGQAMSAGHIYTIAGNGTAGFSGDGGAASAAELDEPAGVCFDAFGDVVVADTQNHRVRVVAAVSGSLYGQPVKADDIYTIAGNGKEGSSGDGGPATAAELSNVWSVALDAAGNLVLADAGNARVRFVPALGGTFYGQAMAADSIYTIAGNGKEGNGGDGGPAGAAELDFPLGVAADPAGDVAIADESGRRVRLLPAHSGGMFGTTVAGGDIYTIAGVGTMGFSGDGGPATAAQLAEPSAVAFDSAGNLLVADGGSNRVRIVYGGPPPVPTVLPVPGPGGGPPRKTPPLLGAVRQSHARWREGSRLARISRRGHRPPLGTTFSFALDQPAAVTIRFTQPAAGRRRGRLCVAPTRHNRSHRRCTRTLLVGTLTLAAHPGTDRVGFQGRLSRTRRLRPGRYTAVFTAANAGGTSAARSITFTIAP